MLSLRALQAVRKHLAEQGDSLGIPIYIEELTKRDKLFHQYKTVTAMSDWQRENITCSPVLCDIGEEPAYDALLAKVHPTRYISYLTLQVHKAGRRPPQRERIGVSVRNPLNSAFPAAHVETRAKGGTA